MSNFHETRDHQIRSLAYQLWEEAGRPVGREDEFWQLAKERLDHGQTHLANDDLDTAGADSFPASDPVNHT